MSESYCCGVRSYCSYLLPWIVPETGSGRLGLSTVDLSRSPEFSTPPGIVRTVSPPSFLYQRAKCREVSALDTAPMLAISTPTDRPLALVACQAPSWRSRVW